MLDHNGPATIAFGYLQDRSEARASPTASYKTFPILSAPRTMDLGRDIRIDPGYVVPPRLEDPDLILSRLRLEARLDN